jgi:hypothetical protein
VLVRNLCVFRIGMMSITSSDDAHGAYARNITLIA